jgi:hypothetical protein
VCRREFRATPEYFYPAVFLPRLYRDDRPLFWTCVLFAAASLAVVAFRHPSTPFGVWAMYSVPKPAGPQAHTFYTLVVDGDERPFSPAFADPRTYFFTSSVANWDAVRSGKAPGPVFATLRALGRRANIPADHFLDRVTPADVAAYGPWLRRAVESRTGKKGQPLEVRRLTLHYPSLGHVQAWRTEVVLVP